jgi:hypothetical protein
VQSVTTASDLYAELGVSASASTEEITAAFRVHAKELHPDRHPGDGKVAERFKALTHAYNVLGRPESRAAYDRRHTTGPAPARRPPTPPPVPSPAHGSVFRTPARARAAVWGGVALCMLGIAAGVVLAGIDTGDSAKTITLWIVVVKLVVCGALLIGLGLWRLGRLRAQPV